MLNKLMKGLVDSIYGTGRVRRKYEQANPDEKVLAADASKGIITNQDQGITRGTDWVTSQRAVVLLTSKKIKCGKWTIPIEQIQSAQLLKFRSLFGDGAVLKLQTVDGTNYQFGMQINPEWIEQQVIPLTYEQAKIKHSPFSIAVRVIAVGYLIYWTYERFIAN
jgi:hypothetical protein